MSSNPGEVRDFALFVFRALQCLLAVNLIFFYGFVLVVCYMHRYGQVLPNGIHFFLK